MGYELTNPDSIEAWAEMIKPFFPNSFGMACTAFQDQLPYGFFFKPDGTKYWMMGTSGSAINEVMAVHEYNL